MLDDQAEEDNLREPEPEVEDEEGRTRHTTIASEEGANRGW